VKILNFILLSAILVNGQALAAETPEPVAHKIAVAVTAFSVQADKPDLVKASDEIRQLFEAKLGEQDLVVVERAKLDEALHEAKLSQAGIVDPNSAKDVGKVIGADFIVTGRISEIGGTMVVSGRAIDTETSAIIPVSIEVADKGQIVASIGKAAATLSEKMQVAKKAKATEVNAVAVDKSLPAGPRPKVLVLFNEIHIGRPVIDPASETALVRYLLANDFKVVDPAFAKGLRGDEEKWRPLQNAGEGAVALLAKLGKEQNADVVIYGEAFSERGESVEGMLTCRGRIEAKAVLVKDGSVLAYDSEHAGASDLAEHVAGKKAIEAAAQKVAPRLATLVLKKWANPKAEK